MQGTIRPAGAQAPRLVIVGPARYPIDHLRKKASERSSAIAQPMKPALHNVHGHGAVLRPASVATPHGNAHGAGQPMVIGPAKATGPAHSKHEAMSRMDQQPLPLPCEMAPSVTSMTRGTVTGSIRPASVGHANQAGSQSESRLQGGHSTVWRPHTQAALQPSIPTPIGAVIRGPATSNHPVHTSRVAPIWSSIDLPKGKAVRRTHSASEAHVLTTQQLSVSSHSSASNYVDITPLLAKRHGRGRGRAIQVAPNPLVGWTHVMSGEVAPPLPKRTRTRMTEAQKSTLISQSDVEMYKSNNAAEWLADILPKQDADRLLGGSLGASQIPDPAERRIALVEALKSKAGSDGAALSKARRAFEKLSEFARERGVPNHGLPATAVFVFTFLRWIDAKALQKGTGTQGGAHVSASTRAGLLILADHFGLQIAVHTLVAEAGVPTGKKRCRPRQSASLGVQFYCHFELQARATTDSPERSFVRSICLAGLFASLRLVDVLRATFHKAEPMADGTYVVLVVSSFSKDGAPIDVYVPAIGFMGPMTWAQEHVESLTGKPFVLEAFTSTSKNAGKIEHAISLKGRVMPADHALKSLKTVAAKGPLCMTEEDWKQSHTTPHSLHGSPADIIASILDDSGLGETFSSTDENEISHWRRRDRYDVGDVDLPSLQSATAGPAPGWLGRADATDEHLTMRVRYTSGEGRGGRRRSQLSVRWRFAMAVAKAIGRMSCAWHELPKGANSYVIFDRPIGMADDNGAGAIGI